MKTRRGFFAAIVGAIATPLALKLFPKREPQPEEWTVDIEPSETLVSPQVAASDEVYDALSVLNKILDHWNEDRIKYDVAEGTGWWDTEWQRDGMTYSNGTLTETKEITYAELEKTYGEVKAMRDRTMLVNPKYAMSNLPFNPAIYPLRFHKDAFTFVMNPCPLDRTITLTYPDGTNKVVTINQGEQNS